MRFRLEADGPEDLRGLGVGLAGLGSRVRRVLQRDAQIFADRHAGERLRDLEASHDAELGPPVGRQRGDVTTLEEDPAAVRGERAGHAIDERRLPDPFGPMRPNRSPALTDRLTRWSAVKPPK